MLQGDLTKSGRQTIASVCICTCRRPEGLRRLLASLAAQRDAPDFDVVVVDNDQQALGRDVALLFQGPLTITYVHDPDSCLAGARNRSVQSAQGRYLAFIDDDEEAPPTWLQTLHRVMVNHEADVVGGTADVIFAPNVPQAVRNCRIFRRRNFPAEGLMLPWYLTFTGNAYVRRSALPDPIAPFAITFGATGGEDVDCFKKIHETGGRIIAAGSGACVTEFREYERANFWWVVRRSVRNGGNLADMQWRECSGFKKAGLAALSLKQAIAHGWRACLLSRKDAEAFVEKTIDAGEQLGRMLSVFGYRYPEYGSRQ